MATRLDEQIERLEHLVEKCLNRCKASRRPEPGAAAAGGRDDDSVVPPSTQR